MARADNLFPKLAIEQFNRYGGKKPRQRVQGDTDRGSVVRQIARGDSSIRASTRRNYRRATGGTGGGFRANPARVDSAIQGVFDKLTETYQENVAEREALERIQQQNTESAVEDRGLLGNVWNAISGIGEEGEEGGFEDSVVGRSLDIINRPRNAIHEGLQRLAAQEENTGFSPSDLWSTVKNFGGGLKAGITGEETTGFGEVYESYKNNPVTALGPTLRNFEENHPRLEQTLAQTVGFAGEVAAPFSILAGSSPTIMRGAAADLAGTSGRVATEDVFKETLLRAAGEVTDDFATGSHLVTGAYARNPALLNARIRNSIEELFNEANVTVQGGGSRARRTMNSRLWPGLVANRTQQEILEATTEFFNTRVDDLWTRGSTGNYTAATVDTFRQYSNDFDEFWGELQKGFPSTATTDDILDAIKGGRLSKTTLENARLRVLSKYDSELQKVGDEVFSLTKNPAYRTVGVRVGNKTVPFRLPGRAYDYMGTKLADNLIPNRAADSLDRTFYERQFPGIFGVKATQARAIGLSGMDQFQKDLQKFARDYSKDQAREIQELLEKGVHTTGDAHMDKGLKFVREELDKIFREEQAVGARAARGVGSKYGDNYTYIYLRGGNQAKRTDFKEGRKKAWNNKNTPGPEGFDMAYAKSQGLRPVENAFENLRLRKAKSGRDQVRAAFLQDLVDNYSVYGGKPTLKLSQKAVESRNLVQVPYNRLNASFRNMADTKGGVFYLPKEMSEVANRFHEMTSWTSSEWPVLGRAFAKTINVLKALLTLPFTGFHTKNFIGDVFMGLMDDINPNDYARVARKFTLDRAGKLTHFEIIPKHLKLTWKEMYGKYLDNADAGFFDVEFGSYHSKTAGDIPSRFARGTVSKVRELSDARETIPRFVHFQTAYQDEARALWKSGMRDLKEIERRAINAGVWRVNHYKFDYSALLPWEKKLKTLAFPFYTYLRKAIPALVEQMYLNPHYLSAVGRYMQYNDGSAADDFNDMNIPQWIRDLGFGVLTDEKEPMAVTADILPLGALDILSSMSPNELQPNSGFDPTDLLREGLSNLNPIAQAPIESVTGQTLFDNRPIQGNFIEYIMDNLPLIHDLQEEVVDIPGLPGGGNRNNALWDYAFGEPERPLWESLISNRFAGTGLPIRRIHEGQQFQQQQANADRLVEDPISDFNRSQDRISISQTERFTYLVRDRITGVEQGEYNTPQEAIEAAQRFGNYQMPQTSPYSPPDMSAVFKSLSG